ncbi:MAG: hypothetical protein IPM89_11530 [Candidatus Competibacteraceae bacterium]|nr:MAG: hypothetical protein IPM89_11530 [Candidatus Competibacteraceae bacterium]
MRVDDDDVVAVKLAQGSMKWHVVDPAVTCYEGSRVPVPGRTAAMYHVPTGRLARSDGIKLNDGEVCGNCRRALKVRIRNDREREQFRQRR